MDERTEAWRDNRPPDYLWRITQARKKRGASNASYVAAIRDAVEAGESKTAVAEAAGISRPTLYALLAEIYPESIRPYYK